MSDDSAQKFSLQNLASELSELRNQLEVRQNELHTDLKLLDDLFLLKFLRACETDVKQSAQVLINYFQARVDHPEIFRTAFDDEKIRAALLTNVTVRCSRKNEKFDGATVLYVNSGNWPDVDFDVNAAMAAGCLITEYFLMDESAQINGIHRIEDPSLLTFRKLMRIPRSMMKTMSKIFEGSFPHNIKSISMVNESFIFSLIMKIVSPFLSQKVKDQLKLYGKNYEALKERFDTNCIPKYLGGEWDPNEDFVTDEKIDEMSKLVGEMWKKYPVIKRN